MKDFFKSLTEQACGNVYKFNRRLNEAGYPPQGGGAGMNPMMGGDGGMDPMAGGDGSNMGGDGGMDPMAGGDGSNMGGDGGITLSGEQVSQLNQLLAGIGDSLSQIQSMMGGEVQPMGQDPMMGADGGGPPQGGIGGPPQAQGGGMPPQGGGGMMGRY